MTWMVLALLSSAIFGAVAVIDKRLLDRDMPSLASYYLWTGGAVLVYGLLFLITGGLPEATPPWRLAIAVLSGLCWGAAMALTFWGYKLQEVSRASAVVFTFPVMVALLAMVFLGESLGPLQLASIIMVMAGAFLISSNGSPGKGLLQLNRAFPILLGASLLTALGHFTGKYALQELPVSLVTSLRFLGMAATLAIFWRPRAISELRQAMKRREAIILLVVAEVLLVPVAILLMMTATKLGPVSLVATLTGTRPVFIFLYGTILSLPGLRFMGESLAGRAFAVKLASVVMIIGGIVSL